MLVDYLLPETVVVVRGSVELVDDQFDEPGTRQYREADVEVVSAVRGDEGNGLKTVSIGGGRGDNDFSIDLTADRRLSAVSFKSTGSGGRIVAASATLVASIAGVALKAASPFQVQAGNTDVDGLAISEAVNLPARTVEEVARSVWEAVHFRERDHRAAYVSIAAAATDHLRDLRRGVADDALTVDQATMAAIYRLEHVLADAQAEIAKVDTLYASWRESTKTRRTEERSFTFALDTLRLRGSDAEPNINDLVGTAERAWDELGVLVELGPADGYTTARSTPVRVENSRSDSRIVWRIPRKVRLWVWRRAADSAGKPTVTLERTFDVDAVDKHSAERNVEWDRRTFGEVGGTLAFDPSGSLIKVARSDKGAAGAVADAVNGIPAAIASGLDSVMKTSASFDTLTDSDGVRRLALLKREAESKTQELELKGLDATADDFAEAKRLAQRVAMADATSKLSPAKQSELAAAQNELALLTARRDTEALVRQRQLDGELAVAQGELARLSLELQLERARNGEANPHPN